MSLYRDNDSVLCVPLDLSRYNLCILAATDNTRIRRKESAVLNEPNEMILSLSHFLIIDVQKRDCCPLYVGTGFSVFGNVALLKNARSRLPVGRVV